MEFRCRSGSGEIDPEEQKRAALHEMHEIAAELFQNNLRGSAGAEARRYLESRNVSKAAMDEFRIGLALESWDQLTQKLQRFGVGLMEESGLVETSRRWRFLRLFSGRESCFPFITRRARLIGFGGRATR